jgi:hydrophobe/amphiphile efflux-1 (HAE1) family protein
MSLSAPFIRRPVATFLLTFGILLGGYVAYRQLPVASLPAVDFPTVRVYASLPGASPETMAASVATPLERQLGQIAEVTQLTSSSGLGYTSISVQFSLDRSVDDAARDVQAAINAAASQLPEDLPNPPRHYKSNPAQAPIMILALTCETLPAGKVYDYADTVVAQKLSQIDGVSEVGISGAEKTAVRVRVKPAALASLGLGLEDIRVAVAQGNSSNPKGSLEGERQSYTIGADDQLFGADAYRRLIVAYRNGAAVRLGDIAEVVDATANTRVAGRFNQQRAVIVYVYRQPGANIVETSDRIRAATAELAKWLPPAVKIAVLSDRTGTIRAAITDIKYTLTITIALVVMVMLLFLRRFWATLIPSITIPVAIAGTCVAMYALHYTLDNLSLMALTIAVGFVVDDAIVMIENVVRHMEAGETAVAAALKGARQIGFTVVSITVSLIAAFIPLLFMGGYLGRFFREFSVTLTAAIAISGVVSLTLTPAMCGKFLRRDESRPDNAFQRACERGLAAMRRLYEYGLRAALAHRLAMLLATLAICAATVWLYRIVPKGFFPPQETGIIRGITDAAQDISFAAMLDRQTAAEDVILADPAVDNLNSYVGGGSYAGLSTGYLYINLKPRELRRATAEQVIDRLRPKLARIYGINTYLFPVQDIMMGARIGKGQYQYTLQDENLDELNEWLPRIRDKLKTLPELKDVSTDQQINGLQAALTIDRDAASRLGVSPRLIDNTLYDAFGQRQVSTVYAPLDQFRTVLEIDPALQQDPATLRELYVKSASGKQVPLSEVTKVTQTTTPLSLAHQGEWPATTISFNLAPDVALGQATDAIHRAEAELELPGSLRPTFQGNARAFRAHLDNMPLLILAAVIAVYIILGVLYESLIHPLTIISTLPSAGLGALLALLITRTELSIIAMIGIILLIGIVKKNAIMMVDFAIEAERNRGLLPYDAMVEACLLRFRPIMMTTLAALLGALPMALDWGSGSELRKPLGIAIVGGLVVSQFLTLFTTPVVYLYLDRLRKWRRNRPSTIERLLEPAG